jgi:hypothetical protein
MSTFAAASQGHHRGTAGGQLDAAGALQERN